MKEIKEGFYQELTAGGIRAFPEAEVLILQAKALRLPLGVGSSGAPAKIARNLTVSGLVQHFEQEYVVSAYDKNVAKGKPAPDIYLEAMRRLGVTDPSRVLIVEDAVHGLNAAKAAGAFAVGVTNSLPRQDLLKCADLVVDRLDEIELASLSPLPRASC